jgi:hypothetical protein
MRREFVGELAQRLDAKFAVRSRAGHNGAAMPSRNGAPRPRAERDNSTSLARTLGLQFKWNRRGWLTDVVACGKVGQVCDYVAN